jgi:membrane-associated phospholipid phosphatase
VSVGRLLQAWLIFLVIAAAAVAVCIRWLDVPVALVFLGHASRFSGLGRGLNSNILVSGELALIASLSIARLICGHLSEFAKAVYVASCGSLSAFAANDYVLKVIFGRQNPATFFQEPTIHVFNFLQGNEHSSFPSGHMVMATAFAAVLIRLQPRTWPVLTALLAVGAVALLIGDWHFISDVIAGGFVGGTAGFVAGELWDQHSRNQAMRLQP